MFMICNEWINACYAILNFGYMNGHSSHFPRLNYGYKIECLQVWSWSIISKCFWSHRQIPTMKIRQHFALFSWWKSGSASPQMCHSTQNTILTMLSMWEYGNRDALFSQRKSGRFSRFVCYGASAGFCVYVYGVYWHACTVTSWSLSTHQAH